VESASSGDGDLLFAVPSGLSSSELSGVIGSIPLFAEGASLASKTLVDEDEQWLVPIRMSNDANSVVYLVKDFIDSPKVEKAILIPIIMYYSC